VVSKHPTEKRAINRFIDAELLDAREKQWLANRAAITSINSFIERHGLLADKLRYRPDGAGKKSR
jgi:post-segregation antitoxin (ccd killing protein)